ncbi:glycosyltransferase family 2 protein [Spirosoma agri]|uniref:Glycosyltransferase family 2 protein n=1 Tax=Spirosoma agri TaxID=1987381 RepID=A0A6M0IFV6_9BACT|nr:glycosyltransferase family 2 protein [Spirosoma agri]NEU66757.1 glycosyltransferase family 2 protein [Spirosoma agri]
MRIAGVIVLYNSALYCIQNIKTYLPQIDKLFIIDNSDYIDESMVKELTKLTGSEYIYNHGNQGIAQALNEAAKRAIEEEYDYLLTMDDDSSAPTTMIAEMKQFISAQIQPDRLGIISAAHLPATLRGNVPNRVLYTMTSGNLLNLRAYQAVGPFRDDFFIDHVDHEYSLRLNSSGYSITELPTVRINHPVGEKKIKWGVTYVSRQPVRQYYMVRNGIIVAKQYFHRYPIFTYKMIKLLIKEWLKIILAQTNRRQRMAFMMKGLSDGLSGRTGKV